MRATMRRRSRLYGKGNFKKIPDFVAMFWQSGQNWSRGIVVGRAELMARTGKFGDIYTKFKNKF